MRTPSGRSRLGLAAAVAMGALLLEPVIAYAVLVSPHAVFMDHRTRTGQVYLVNTGSTPEEISVDLAYGYPDTDSSGSVFIRLIDRPDSTQPSAAEFVRAYPRRVVVLPGNRQVIRLLAQPPAGLPDGEYWSRIIVSSRGQELAVAGADSAVHAGVSLEVRTIISLNYRKGTVRTGVTLQDFRASVERDSLIAWVGLSREGNAAFLGTTRLAVQDSTGAVRGEWSTPTAVYVPVSRRYAFPLEGLSRGRYVVTLDVNTSREDLPATNILPAAPIRRTVGLDVP
jgi:hypothetical protein